MGRETVNERLDQPLISRRKFIKGVAIAIASSWLLPTDQGQKEDPMLTKVSKLPPEGQKIQEELRINYEECRPKGDFYEGKQMFIDYSHHQGGRRGIDVNKQQLSPWRFIAKASEITMNYGGGVDDSFRKLQESIMDRPIGGYMFLNRWRNDIEAQCKLYINTVTLKKGDFRPIVDIEDRRFRKISHKNIDEVLEKLQKTITILKTHYGVDPIIYTSESVYRNLFKGKIDSNLPIWVANYNGVLNDYEGIDMRQCSQYSKAAIYKKKAQNTDVNVILREDRIFMPH